MIIYTDSLQNVGIEHLQGGFFVGWPNPPSPKSHFQILSNSSAFVLARTEQGTVVGFITAISDNISCAYIPHLEVLPAYQDQGIGSELVRCMTEKLMHLYMVDLICDPALQSFYKKFGMQTLAGMVIRNYDRQSCEPISNKIS